MMMMMMTYVQDCTVISIVLGISFDQGRMMKMPEQVLFRLSREMVDVMGVEGVFR